MSNDLFVFLVGALSFLAGWFFGGAYAYHNAHEKLDQIGEKPNGK